MKDRDAILANAHASSRYLELAGEALYKKLIGQRFSDTDDFGQPIEVEITAETETSINVTLLSVPGSPYNHYRVSVAAFDNRTDDGTHCDLKALLDIKTWFDRDWMDDDRAIDPAKWTEISVEGGGTIYYYGDHWEEYMESLHRENPDQTYSAHDMEKDDIREAMHEDGIVTDDWKMERG